jgi:hypothetical protein
VKKVSQAHSYIAAIINELAAYKTMIGNGLLASFGAAANYVYISFKRETALKMMTFCVALFLGFFVGMVAGNFIPHDFAYRDGCLLVAGFAFHPILGMLENKIPKMFEARIRSVIAPSTDRDHESN